MANVMHRRKFLTHRPITPKRTFFPEELACLADTLGIPRWPAQKLVKFRTISTGLIDTLRDTADRRKACDL